MKIKISTKEKTRGEKKIDFKFIISISRKTDHVESRKTDWDHGDDDLCYYSSRKQLNSQIVSLSSVAVLWLLTDENKLRKLFFLIDAQRGNWTAIDR